MSVKPFDIYTFWHFLIGFLSYLVLSKFNISTVSNFLISNGIHLFIELLEHNTSPTGRVLETTQNHIGDIVFFFLGWCMSVYFNIKVSSHLYPFIFIIVLVTMTKEILREIFPYGNNMLLKGAFM